MFLPLVLCLIQSWESGPPMPTPRYGFGIGVVDNKIYVIGGRDDYNILDVVEVYNPATNSWDTTSLPNLPTPRCFVGSAVYNDKIYIIGGMTHLGSFFTSTSLVERYDPATYQWDTVASLFDVKEALGACTYQNNVYAIGGFECESLGVYKNTVERYYPLSDYWIEVDSLNTPRINLGVTVCNNKIYALGGSYYNPLSSVEYYVSNYWFPDLPMIRARSGLSVATYGDSMYAIAGEDYRLLNSVDIFFQDSIWIDGPPLNQARAYFGVAIVNDTIYVIGGKGISGSINTMEFHQLPIPGINETDTEVLSSSYLFPTIVRKGTHIKFTQGDEIKIYNSMGSFVLKSKNSIRIDLAQGVYFIQIQRNGCSFITKKIIVIK